MKVIQGLYSGVTTVELDTLAAETAATLTTKHPDYAILAARIAVSNLHKETKKVFSGECVCGHVSNSLRFLVEEGTCEGVVALEDMTMVNLFLNRSD